MQADNEADLIRFSEKDNALCFTVRVVPRASNSEIAGEHDGALKIRLAALPVEGAANRELVKVLAEFFEVPKNVVEIIGGAASKTKQIRVSGAKPQKLKQI